MEIFKHGDDFIAVESALNKTNKSILLIVELFFNRINVKGLLENLIRIERRDNTW